MNIDELHEQIRGIRLNRRLSAERKKVATKTIKKSPVQSKAPLDPDSLSSEMAAELLRKITGGEK